MFFDSCDVSALLSPDYFSLGYFFIVGVNSPTEIDSSISRAVKDANKISRVKNIFADGRIKRIENFLIYLIQGYQSYKDNKKGSYGEFF